LWKKPRLENIGGVLVTLSISWLFIVSFLLMIWKPSFTPIVSSSEWFKPIILYSIGASILITLRAFNLWDATELFADGRPIRKIDVSARKGLLTALSGLALVGFAITFPLSYEKSLLFQNATVQNELNPNRLCGYLYLPYDENDGVIWRDGKKVEKCVYVSTAQHDCLHDRAALARIILITVFLSLLYFLGTTRRLKGP
jgi:hypothetical protein